MRGRGIEWGGQRTPLRGVSVSVRPLIRFARGTKPDMSGHVRRVRSHFDPDRHIGR